MGLRPHLSLCACKTARLAPELLVSMGPCPHLWFLHAKQGLLDQNYKSLLVSALISGFCMQNSVICIRLTSLYGFQLSSAVLSTHNSVLSPRIWRPYGSQPSPVVLCMQNRDFRTRIKSLCGSKTPPVVFSCKTGTFGPELQVSFGPSPYLWLLLVKQRHLDQNNKSL